jgi:hypothetical protein
VVRICYFDFQIASFHGRGVLTGVILLDVGPFIGTILLNRYLEKKVVSACAGLNVTHTVDFVISVPL